MRPPRPSAGRRDRLAFAAALLLLVAAGLFLLLFVSPLRAAEAPGPRPAAAPAATPVRDARTLPALARIAAPETWNGTIVRTDTFLSVSHGFQELDGACAPRGWTAEDLTARLYAHVSDQYVVNRAVAGGRSLHRELDVQTAPIAGTAFGWGGQLALNDSGRVVFFDVGCAPPPCGRVLYEIYPQQDLLRRYTNEGIAGYRPRTMVADPATGGFLVADGANSIVYQILPGDSVSRVFADFQATTQGDVDTTLQFAEVDALDLAADSAGNIYFTEIFGNRLRMIRRSDLRVVTLLPAASSTWIAVNPDGSELFHLASDGVRRLDLATLESTVVHAFAAGDPLANTEDLAWSDGQLYFALNYSGHPSAIYRLAGGGPERVAGATSFYGPAAGAWNGLQTPLARIGGLCADGAGGVCFTSGALVLRLRADGGIEHLAGDRIAIGMGARALRVGADMTTAPDEVRHWRSPSGFGNGWSQRITSPPVDLTGVQSDAVLTFDLASELGAGSSLDVEEVVASGFLNEFVAVEAIAADGRWIPLACEIWMPMVQANPTFFHPVPLGTFQVVVRLADLGLATPTRFRIVVQTSTTLSNEDLPLLPDGGGGAAILDNLALRALGADLLPPLDFEDGTTGGWTLAALNGAYDDVEVSGRFVRNGPPPATRAELRTQFDFADPSCVWTFTSEGDTLPPGVFARLTSPWIPRMNRAGQALISFAGKLNTSSQGRVLDVRIRGKDAGDERPRAAFIPAFLLNSGTTGGDLASPFIAGRIMRFPNDFFAAGEEAPADFDSIQVVFLIEDRREQLVGNAAAGVTKLPYLDDVRILEPFVDRDHDGIADLNDACPDETAAGQDADHDGCVDPTATFHHVETWPRGEPIRYAYTTGGNGVVAGAFAALDSAFAAWTRVSGGAVPLEKLLPTTIRNGSPFDGINVVSFEDELFPFSPEVLAVTTTLELTQRTAYGDRVLPPGTIVDKDILFNPGVSFSTPQQPGTWDLESVAAHEIGHLLGLDHSGVRDATLYFVQQDGTEGASLHDDDRAAIAAAYPAADLLTAFGSIRGEVRRDTSAAPVGGALVTAVRLDGALAPVDTVASDYTDERGRFAIFRLPPGSYGLHVQALDGTVLDGLQPAFVSARLASATGAPFEPEWYSAGDDPFDDRDLRTALEVAAGTALTGLIVTTNLDTVPARVTATNPADGATAIGVDASLQITFSEPIDPATLNAAFSLSPRLQPQVRLGGNALVSDRNRRLVFTPQDPLAFKTEYVIRLTTALRDASGQALAAEFTSEFETQVQPPVSITNVQPRSVAPGTLLTITGTGFVPDDFVVVAFDGAAGPDTATVSFLTPTSLVVQVPASRAPGLDSVTVIVDDLLNRSNGFAVTILPPAEQPSPTPSGAPVALPFAPTDVELAPDGAMAYVAGDGGFATVNLAAPNGGPLRVAVLRDPRPARALALAPDGGRAFVTHAADSAVAVFDARPSSATLGAELAVIPLLGRPGPIAVAPTGFRAFAGDEANGVIHEIDIREGGTGYAQIAAVPFAPGAITGLDVMDDNSTLVVGSTGGGFFLRLDTRGPSPQVFGPGMALGGVSASPLGFPHLFAIGPNRIAEADNQFIVTGGSTRDVRHSPQGQAAYVVNSQLNRLQVLNVQPSSPRFRTIMTDVATGAFPVAVAVDQGGGLVAVANHGSRDLSLYQVTQAGVPALVRVAPAVAIPGQAVSAQGLPSSGFSAPTQVDLGVAAPFPASNAIGRGAGFRVPAAAPAVTGLVLERPDQLRSFSLPFTIVAPLVPAAAAPVFAIVEEDTACGATSNTRVGGFLRALRATPDGRRIGVIRENFCAGSLDLYSAAADDGTLGALIGTVALTPPGSPYDRLDGAFTGDGRRFWSVGRAVGVRVTDTDPASASFGATVALAGSGAGGPVILADPLGRTMITGTSNAHALAFWDVDAESALAVLPDVRPWSLAASGDGRHLVVGTRSVARIIDLATRAILATTPVKGPNEQRDSLAFEVPDSMYYAVEVTRDGRRAMGLWGSPQNGNPRRVAVWNLDPAAGPVGQELYFGRPAGTEALHPASLTPGPSASGIIATSRFSTALLHFDLAVIPPAVTLLESGAAAGVTSVQASPDGRRVWTAEPGNAGTSALDGVIRLRRLDDAAAMTLVAGAAQSAIAGSALPFPVQVRLTGGTGAPVSGALVTFSLAPGQGDLGGAASRTLATDLNGEARVTWRMPLAPGTVVLGIAAAGNAAIAPLAVAAQSVLDDAQVPPQITALSPAPGTQGLNAGTPVGARFNQPMSDAVLDDLTLLANGQPVAGSARLVENRRFLLFTPAQPLPFGAACALSVSPGATDLDGQALAAGASGTFTVQPPPPVRIDALVPPAGPPGAGVTVSGTGFEPLAALNTVLFNGVIGTVATATGTGLTTKVPLSAASGPVTVTAGQQTSAGFNFIVLPPNADPGGVIGDLPAGQGSRDIALAPDGSRAYVTNPPLNVVNVLDLVAAQTLTAVTVGLRPAAIAMLPSPPRAYVANQLSNSVSVIDTDPASASYHQVVQTIPVGAGPVDVTIAGGHVYVLNAGSATLTVIDAVPGNATFDQVTGTVNCGGGATQVVISADGTTAYVATAGGLQIIDIAANAVTGTVNCGAATTQVVISADGTLAFVLTATGELVIVALTGPSANQVVGTVNCGAGASQVVITADGTLAYVTSSDGTVQVFQITGGAGDPSTTRPGAAPRLVPVEVFTLGGAPFGIAPDPLGRLRVWVANPATGVLHALGTPDALPRLEVRFQFNPGTLNVRSMGRWVKGTIEPDAPFSPDSIVIASLRLGGVVAADPAYAEIGDHDGDGLPDVRVRFPRVEVHLLLPAGNAVPVCVSGRIGARNFTGCDTIRVRHGRVTMPAASDVLPPGEKTTVRWQTAGGDDIKWVSLLYSLDRGVTWTLIAERVPNEGVWWWDVPLVAADSARLAVVFVEEEHVPQEAVDPDYLEDEDVVGVFAMSAPFSIFGATSVPAVPAELSFTLEGPNPARGAARMRFGLPARGEVDLEIFDLAGRRVATLARGVREAGWHTVGWTGRHGGGGTAGAGIYFVRFRAGGRTFDARLVWLR